MAEINKKWYVVRAISGKEKKVKDAIELETSRAGMGDYVSQILIPTVNKQDDKQRGDVGTRHRQQNIEEKPHRPGAIDARCFE